MVLSIALLYSTGKGPDRNILVVHQFTEVFNFRIQNVIVEFFGIVHWKKDAV